MVMCSPEIETNPIHVPRHTMTIHVHKRQARATAKAPILSLPLHLGFFASSDCWKTSIYSIFLIHMDIWTRASYSKSTLYATNPNNI